MAYPTITVSLPEELVEDMDAVAEEFEEYRSRSHLVQVAIREFLTTHHFKFLMEEEGNDQG